MNVNLGTTFDEFVAELLKTGLYQSQSEILREGLRLLKDREDLKRLRLAELRREVLVGEAEADQGDVVDGPLAFKQLRARSAQLRNAPSAK